MKRYLLTPGPTPIPEDVSLSMARPIIHHRTPDFAKILEEVIEGLKYVYQTKNDVLILTASGTGAMQASISNYLSSSDKILVVEGGKFGARFSDISKTYGLEVVSIEVEWGKAVDPEIIKQKLDEDSSIKAVYITQCETSTGVLTDVEAISKIVAPTEAILAVDAISSLAACDLKTDVWGVDIVISGSQKGLMTPPGLSFISVSEKAWSKTSSSNLPKFYFDALQAKKNQEKFNTPWTPAITLLIGLNVALNIIKEEGLENIFAKYAKLANATRSAVEAIGLELFASNPANAVTAVKAPNNIDGQEIVKIMKSELGLSIAGGQADLKGKIFRIAHMGYIDKFDIIMAISALEITLEKLGYDIKLGEAVSVAESMLLD